MKAKHVKYEHDGVVHHEQIHFFCPGCKQIHAISPKIHSFNGNFEKPTFSPSVLITWGGQPNWCCHSFVRGGFIQFLGDCSHDFKNKTVELPELTEDMR